MPPFWPLWIQARHRRAIGAHSRVAVYISGPGSGAVIASARVARVEPWQAHHQRDYPLMLDGTPDSVLRLVNVKPPTPAIRVKDRLHELSFVQTDPFTGSPTGRWTKAFMGGSRMLSAADFAVLTRVQ